MKDPAFLFYSQDFYAGTRTMVPEERACYMDLLIYQHQNGVIPNDIRRIMMYCSGIDEATLKATLHAKFKLTDEGWINSRLSEVVEKREEFAKKQSINGSVGQFWKKAAVILSDIDFARLKKSFAGVSNDTIFSKIEAIDLKDEAMLTEMLKAMLKHLEIEIEIEIEIENKGKGGKGEKPKTKIPEIIHKVELPFNSIEFESIWQHWKDYKAKEHKYKFKSPHSEQASLISLTKLCGGIEERAMDIIKQSLANGWKGFFELKNNQNAGSKNGRQATGGQVDTASAFNKINQMFGND